MNSTFPIDPMMDGFQPQGQDSPRTSTDKSAAATATAPRTKTSARGTQQVKKPTPSQSPKAPKRQHNEPLQHSIIKFFRSPQTRLALGIILIVLSAMWLIVSINYLKNGPADQSLVAENSIETIANAPEGVQNAGGAVGAIPARDRA